MDCGPILALPMPELHALKLCRLGIMLPSSSDKWTIQHMLQQKFRGTASALSLTMHVTTVLTLIDQPEEAACGRLVEYRDA